MTRLPADDRNIRGFEGPEYLDDGPSFKPATCFHPFCDNNYYSQLERHHLWRRSFLGGDFNWVRFPDGTEVGNVVWLCNKHHREITENRARIEWIETSGPMGVGYEGYVWAGKGFLNPQPPLQSPEGDSKSLEPEYEYKVGEVDAWTGEGFTSPEPGETCQLCKRRVNHPKKDDSPATTRVKSWRVPADEFEARTELLEATARHIGLDPAEKFWMDKLILNLCIMATQPEWEKP